MSVTCFPTPDNPDLDTRRDYGDLLPKLIVIEGRMERDVGEGENMACARYELLEKAWGAAIVLRQAIEDVVRMDAKDRT